jgi:hypothetical protein
MRLGLRVPHETRATTVRLLGDLIGAHRVR